MSFLRSIGLVAFVPVCVLVVALGCSGTTSNGSCAVVVDDSGASGGEARCANGPNAGTTCCVPTSGACSAQLPICDSVCCGTTERQGGPAESEADLDGGRKPDAKPVVDGSTSDAKGDASTGTCPGNTKQKADFGSAQCQAALETSCCAELTACFAITPPASGATDDCNAYATCIAFCNTQADQASCYDECDLASPKSVIDAYEAIVTCATDHPATNAACQ